MNASQTPELPPRRTAPGAQIRTVLLCDLVDSTGLIERLGDAVAVELMRQHDQLVRQLLRVHGGREIDKSDGFLALFEHPVRAVAFALDYQRELHALGNAEGWPLSARVGIHVGDVLLWESDPEDVVRGAKPVNVEGVAKPIAARLMQLARPGQILLSSVAENLARRTDAGLGELAPRVRWLMHGAYRLKGVPAALPVHEVGEPGIAPMKTPVDGEKARRERPAWRRRPAVIAQSIAATALLAIVLMVGLRSDEAIAFRERDWVVIGHLDNRTGDVRFDDALETALRISLEQSRHVNVLPDLRVRETLKRMGREPGEEIDRDTGSEIALREGARALLLPSVAEVGGKLRINLEVIDPNSQRTVHVESAEGAGAESALASMGEISLSLRNRLGEAVKRTQGAHAPMERVTSSSLDALRAYSLGVRDFSVGQLETARQHFEHALSLDPAFAMAEIALGRYQFTIDKPGDALSWFRRAEARAERLTERERLNLTARIAMLMHEPSYLERLKTLSDLYPDDAPAAHNYAQALMHVNRPEEGRRYASRATFPQSVTRAYSIYLMGVFALMEGDVATSKEHFQFAESLGLNAAAGVHPALPLAAERDFGRALRRLRQGPPISPAHAVDVQMTELAFAVDRADWSTSQSLAGEIATALVDADKPAARGHWGLRTALLTMAAYTGSGRDLERQMGDLIAEAKAVMHSADPGTRERLATALLSAGLVSARVDRNDLAMEARDAAAAAVQQSPHEFTRDLALTVSAASLVNDGSCDRAVATLEPMLDRAGPFMARRILADAYRCLGRVDDSRRMLAWVADHRAVAYAEWTAGRMLQLGNLFEASLASIELVIGGADANGRQAAADWLQKFNAAWPSAASLRRLGELSAEAGAVDVKPQA